MTQVMGCQGLLRQAHVRGIGATTCDQFEGLRLLAQKGLTRLSLSCLLLAVLRRLIDHATTPGVWGATPSDFPRARVSQRDLDRLLATIGAHGGGDDA